MAPILYRFIVDTRRDESYLAPIDDLTSRLIGQATWNIGMDSPEQSFAKPARLTVTLDNMDGAFNKDTLGAELLTNGDFATWSGDNPSSWTVTGEVGADPEISQVSRDALHGGGGTGAANFYSTSAVVSIKQTILTSGTSYKCTIDISRSSEGTGYFAIYANSILVSPPYHLAGIYTFYFNATGTEFKIESYGACNMTVNTVSVKATSVYGNLVTEGILCEFEKLIPGKSRQFVGRLTSIVQTPGSISRRLVTLTFSDPMYDLLDAEYIPPLYTNVTADVPIRDLLESPLVPFPYSASYWMVGVQGSSELTQTTYIYFPPPYTLDTGVSVFSWVGDNSIDSEKEGVSAQSFLRDVVEGEIGGRFYYEPQNPGFVFHNRSRDPLNVTSTTTFSDTGDPSYEADMSSFGITPIVNQSIVSYQPRKTGTAASIIWTRENFSMGKGTTKFTARYRDPDNPNARVGATAVIPPLRGVDYNAHNSNGVNVNNKIQVTAEIGANSAEITVVSDSALGATFDNLQLRGTPLTTFEPATVNSMDGDSMRTYRFAPEKVSYRLVDGDIFAQSIADYRIYKHSTPIAAFDKIGFIRDKSSARINAQVLEPIGERITITDSWLGHTMDYYIVGYRNAVTFGGLSSLSEGTHQVTYTLKSADKEVFWILGTSLLAIGTRLAL